MFSSADISNIGPNLGISNYGLTSSCVPRGVRRCGIHANRALTFTNGEIPEVYKDLWCKRTENLIFVARSLSELHSAWGNSFRVATGTTSKRTLGNSVECVAIEFIGCRIHVYLYVIVSPLASVQSIDLITTPKGAMDWMTRSPRVRRKA